MNRPPFLSVEEVLRCPPSVPFVLGMVDARGRILRLPCAECIKVVHARRGVLRALWQGKTVAAKLYAGKNAGRELRRELRAYKMLQRAGLPTPELFHAIESADRRSVLLLFAYLPDAQPLSEVLADAEEPAEKMQRVESMLELVFKMHRRGLWQRDCHPGNFLLQGKQLQLVDLGRVFPLRRKWRARYNLLKLSCWLPPSLRSPLLQLLQKKYGLKLRPWQLELRWNLNLRKKRRVVRGNRDNFVISRKGGRLLAYRHEHWDEKLQEIALDPDGAVQHGEMLRQADGWHTVRMGTENGELLLQCYAPPAGPRTLCPSRAWEYWQNAHLLATGARGDILLPRVLACVEERRGPMRGRSWLLRRPAPGESLAEHTRKVLPEEAVNRALKTIFTAFYTLRFLPEDLNADGFSVHRGRVFFCALEHLQYFRRRSFYSRAWPRMQQAFLDNWPPSHPCHIHYAKMLDAIPRESPF